MSYLGVDGCPDGWIAVKYTRDGYRGTAIYEDVTSLWDEYRDADLVLIDVPIGLRTDCGDPRLCDTAARKVLSPRTSSVFPTPVREAAGEDSYEEAKAKQEELTGKSMNTQTWGITPKIHEVDRFLLEHDEARGVVREAHPEVCFRMMSDESVSCSKTTAEGFWERVSALERLDDAMVEHLRRAASGLGGASNDDLLDAFVLALTASAEEGDLRTLPEKPETDDEGLPMEIVYRDAGRTS